MRTFILLIMAALAGMTCRAQERKPEGGVRILTAGQHITPYRIGVPFSKTVHILFPSEVRYVDLGSTDIIAGKADGVENVVRVKATVRDFPGETNFSVSHGRRIVLFVPRLLRGGAGSVEHQYGQPVSDRILH